MDINYIGEHSLFQFLGNLSVYISFVAALAAAIAYYFSNKDESWKGLGRMFFRLHSLAVLSIVTLMFIMLFNAWYEFKYVHDHRSNAMPIKYILSCFWEGQEGSFLLWTFWNVVLGNILIRSSKNWEAPVLTVFSIIQVFLASMLLGVYILDYKMGSNPFILFRELPEYVGLPWTFREDYLQIIPQFQDGRGLNPLLQNYWMVIHPPIVMLGFALTAIPFAYAIAGLYRNKLSEWINPALPWTYTGIMVLGGGILMGGAWAYEALSFGGFWAWDPVENASLVPWLTLAGGAHVMLVNRIKANSLYAAFFLILSTFILIIYSTFLTRSGVLGDSSVHSFTGNGMIEQLMVFLVFFIALAVALLIRNRRTRLTYILVCALLLIGGFIFDRVILCMLVFVVYTLIMLILAYVKYFSQSSEEDKLWSREFWLFVGAMVLLMSSIQIIFKTSLPVLNLALEPIVQLADIDTSSFKSGLFKKLLAGDLALESPEQIKAGYNKYQVPFAMFITFFMAVTQYLRYKNTPFKELRKKLLIPFVTTVVVFSIVLLAYDWGQYFDAKSFGQKFFGASLVILAFCSIFTVIGNLDYFIRIAKGKLDHAGSSIAHIGFGMVIFGALISTAQSEKISVNSSSQDVAQFNEAFENDKDLFMFQNDTLLMGKHFVSYSNKEQVGINFLYHVDYYSSVPKKFEKGEIVFNARTGGFFRAKRNHEASENFLFEFEENWDAYYELDSIPNNSVRKWAPYEIKEKAFSLSPRIQLNEKFGNVPEPDTKHYLHKDIYTHVKYGDLSIPELDEDGYQLPKEHEIEMQDSIQLNRAFVKIDSLKIRRNYADFGIEDTSALMINGFASIHLSDTIFMANPVMAMTNSGVISFPDEVKNLGLKIGLEKISPEINKLTVSTSLHESVNPDFIIMQAIVFPLINILWLGSILMVVGTFMAIRGRIRKEKLINGKKT